MDRPDHDLRVRRVVDSDQRRRALDVLEAVYLEEKHWVKRADEVFPEADLDDPGISWFLAERKGTACGLARVAYDLPLELYAKYGFQLVDPSFDVEAFLRENRIAEIGRFAVLPGERNRIQLAAGLMRAATTDSVARGFTHYVTDVFENDPNSPYDFHRRVLGFQVVATHDHGELEVLGRRITMLLDIHEAYRRMSRRRNWIFRFITDGWDEGLRARLESVPA